MQVLAKVQARFDGNTNKHLMILPSCQVQARFDEKIHLHFTLSLPQPTYILLYISLFLHVMILPSWKVSHVEVSWFMMRKYTCILLQKKFFFSSIHIRFCWTFSFYDGTGALVCWNQLVDVLHPVSIEGCYNQQTFLLEFVVDICFLQLTFGFATTGDFICYCQRRHVFAK